MDDIGHLSARFFLQYLKCSRVVFELGCTPNMLVELIMLTLLLVSWGGYAKQ